MPLGATANRTGEGEREGGDDSPATLHLSHDLRSSSSPVSGDSNKT